MDYLGFTFSDVVVGGTDISLPFRNLLKALKEVNCMILSGRSFNKTVVDGKKDFL